jgi:hypothetical protein
VLDSLRRKYEDISCGGVSGNLNPAWRQIAKNPSQETVKMEIRKFGGIFDENIFGWRSSVERRGGL